MWLHNNQQGCKKEKILNYVTKNSTLHNKNITVQIYIEKLQIYSTLEHYINPQGKKKS